MADRDNSQALLIDYIHALEASRPLWKKMLGIDAIDAQLVHLRSQRDVASGRADESEKALNEVVSEIDTISRIEKNLQEALVHHSRRRQRERQEKQDADCRTAVSSEAIERAEFDRQLFVINNADYKRGNKIDNYVRGRMFAAIAEHFQGKCLRCECAYDLTLDHYALSKNEGGNFILVTKGDAAALRPNVVVLCKSCNSAKGEIRYLDFFSPSQIEFAQRVHLRLIESIVADKAFLHMLNKWYAIGTLWGR